MNYLCRMEFVNHKLIILPYYAYIIYLGHTRIGERYQVTQSIRSKPSASGCLTSNAGCNVGGAVLGLGLNSTDTTITAANAARVAVRVSIGNLYT